MLFFSQLHSFLNFRSFFTIFVFFRFFLYFQDSVQSRSVFCIFNTFYLTIVLKQYRNELMQEFHQLSHQIGGDREMTISNTPNK